MNKLTENWITEKHIDFEYKKYVLLAYLQHVGEDFNLNRLYPSLSDLVKHYRNVMSLRENKKNFCDSVPERLSGTDYENFRLVYEKILKDDAIMQEVENIIDFSIPQFEKYLSEGKKMYDYIESKLNVFPVGIMPLHTSEGYLMLKDGSGSETKVYEFQVSFFEQASEKFRSIYTVFVSSFEKGLFNTFESIKSEIIRTHQKLPNPATYVIETDLVVPHEETFLPISKRVLVRYITQQSIN